MDFYSLSRFAGPVVDPANIVALLLIVVLIAAATRRKWAPKTAIALAVILLVLLVLPVGPWLEAPLEQRFSRPILPQHIDGVLILGGGESPALHAFRGIAAHIEDEGRYSAAMELMRHFPSARIVFSDQNSAIARAEFAELGADIKRISFEGRARNTWENLLFSKQMVQPRPGEIWLLVTKAYHMPRAIGVARKVGWRMLPWPVDYRTGNPRSMGLLFGDNLNYLERAAHEWSGLFAYWLTGRSAALFPSPAT